MSSTLLIARVVVRREDGVKRHWRGYVGMCAVSLRSTRCTTYFVMRGCRFHKTTTSIGECYPKLLRLFNNSSKKTQLPYQSTSLDPSTSQDSRNEVLSEPGIASILVRISIGLTWTWTIESIIESMLLGRLRTWLSDPSTKVVRYAQHPWAERKVENK